MILEKCPLKDHVRVSFLKKEASLCLERWGKEALGLLGDDVGVLTAGEGREVGDVEGPFAEVFEGGGGVEVEVVVVGFGDELFEVKADGGPVGARPGEAEDGAAGVAEVDDDALAGGDGAVDGVLVLKFGDGGVFRVAEAVDHGVGLDGVDAFKVVADVEVPSEAAPVVLDEFGDGLGRRRGERREPGEDGPEAVFFSDVVGGGAEGFLAAEEGRVLVHQVPEELPAGRHFEARDAQGLGDAVEGFRRRHRSRDGRGLLSGEPRDGLLGIRREDREGIRRRHEAVPP
mmetsp:Transcript_13698/g.44661  ORF Transcript_13698/g.44661 Transcript_13698/m.44661 type:complete len:287 (-) Transcript_13698:64-924(-)